VITLEAAGSWDAPLRRLLSLGSPSDERDPQLAHQQAGEASVNFPASIRTKGDNMNRFLSLPSISPGVAQPMPVKRKILAIGIAFAATLAVAGMFARAEEDNPAALAKALPEASVSLDQGLKASEGQGKPISGKFEIADGALQLSVYTMKGDQFAEVIVDHKAGSIKKSEPITDPGDLKDAKEQGEAMGKAKQSLGAAVVSAVKANSGFRATSVVPMLDGGQPVAAVTLMKGEEVKKVTEKLD
jgi:hypothetical protein